MFPNGDRPLRAEPCRRRGGSPQYRHAAPAPRPPPALTPRAVFQAGTWQPPASILPVLSAPQHLPGAPRTPRTAGLWGTEGVQRPRLFLLYFPLSRPPPPMLSRLQKAPAPPPRLSLPCAICDNFTAPHRCCTAKGHFVHLCYFFIPLSLRAFGLFSFPAGCDQRGCAGSASRCRSHGCTRRWPRLPSPSPSLRRRAAPS